jgi:PmbA protein
MEDELVTLVRDAVERAKKHGASDAWASASRSREVEFTLRDGALEKVQENTSQRLGVTLYVDGRFATHATTSLTPARVDSFIGEAVALTRALQPDPDRELPDPSLYEGRSTDDLDLVDASVGSIDRDWRMERLDAMDAVARANDKVISASSYLSDTHSRSAAASSNGFLGGNEGTAVWMGGSVTVREEGDRRPEGGLYVGSRMAADLLDPKVVAQTALDRALERIGSVKGPTKKTTMVVDPQAGWRLVSSLIGPANARSLHQGRSFWKGKLGESIAPEILTIVDNPLLKRGLGSRPYDSEGIAAKAMPIVEAGVARNVYVDTYYGKKTGMAPTSGDRTNLVVKSGVEKGLNEIIADLTDGIYVTSWLGGNSDSTTGDFSFGLRGHLIENGAIGAPVGEMNVTGNLLDLLGNLALIGNDPWPFRSLQTPTMVFEGVQFSGA